jgi:hypothetical protein
VRKLALALYIRQLLHLLAMGLVGSLSSARLSALVAVVVAGLVAQPDSMAAMAPTSAQVAVAVVTASLPLATVATVVQAQSSCGGGKC